MGSGSIVEGSDPWVQSFDAVAWMPREGLTPVGSVQIRSWKRHLPLKLFRGATYVSYFTPLRKFGIIRVNEAK